MAFMFISCIDLRKATVSSSLHTDLVFLSAAIFSILGGAEASVDVSQVTCFMYIMIYSLSLFPLHFVAFCFYWCINFSSSAKRKKPFLRYYEGFFVQIFASPGPQNYLQG